MNMRRKVSAALAAIALLLAACTLRPSVVTELAGSGPAEIAQMHYRQLLADGQAVYGVDSARSLVVVDVRRAGAFAQFGHDHVVASYDVKGYVAPVEGRGDFHVPLGTLVVDEPSLRTRAGLGPQPDAEDVAGTRQNMLERVLNARQYPYATIRVDIPRGRDETTPIQLALTLHGVTRVVDATATWETYVDEFSATADFAINQSDFGMTPFSILGGAISVRDRLDIRVDIRARRLH